MMKFGPGKWTVIPIPRPSARLQMLCFTHAGGGAFGYRNWAERLPPEVELIIVQMPGRENRLSERPCSNVDEILDALVPVLQQQLRSSYAIFGHSLGGRLAYMLTHRVERRKELPAPTRLIVSGASPPVGGRRDTEPSTLSGAKLLDHLRRLGGTPPDVLDNEALMATLLPVVQADFELNNSMRVHDDGLLDTPITALRGEHDETVHPDAFEAWTALSRHPCQLHVLPGGHFYFHTAAVATFSIINALLALDLRRATTPHRVDP